MKYYQDIAKEIGCYGFISKEEETESLLNKLYLILEEGEKIFPEAKQKEVDLSPTEIEIVKLYSSGLSRKEVAKKTYMSLRSLAVSLNRIYQKLDVQNYQQMSDKARKLVILIVLNNIINSTKNGGVNLCTKVSRNIF